jgi:hypothetical protein
MFDGIASFKMTRVVKAMPILLHISIFLFLAGLVDFLWMTNSAVGNWICALTSVFFTAYLALTVLPNVYLNCPYSTPLSELSWLLSQHLLLCALRIIRGLSPSYRTGNLARWTQWGKAVQTKIEERQKWLKDGLQKSIMLNAIDASSTMDEDALAWTLTVLDDDREFEDFVARVPGFFDSDFFKDAPKVMFSLMNDPPSSTGQFDPILGSCINDLLQTCVQGTSPLPEKLRRNRLRVCMRTLWYFAREYNQPKNTEPLPSYVHAVFATREMIRRIQCEEDLAARLIGRCFNSLIAQKLARDIISRRAQGHHPRDAELSCLADILGKTNSEVTELLSQPGAIDLASIVSLTSSEIETFVKESVPGLPLVPPEVQDIFQKSLVILTEIFLALPNVELPHDLKANFHAIYLNAQRLQAPNWLLDQLERISERSYVDAVGLDVQVVPTLVFPEPEPGTPRNTSNLSSRSRESSTSPLLGHRTLPPL